MEVAARGLRDALVEAYPRYLRELLAHRGWPPVTAAVAEGARLLAESLDELLERPYRDQPRSPLQLFQVAMAAPNAALAAAGVPPPQRDAAAISALPDDRYDLAPASSAALGDLAWRSHLTWGAAKAAAVTRPRVGVLAANLLDRDRIEQATRARGLAVEPVRGAGEVAGFAVLLVDLTDPAAEASISAAAAAGIRVIGFGPHVDEFAMVRARALGATTVLARSQFFRDLPGLLPEYV